MLIEQFAKVSYATDPDIANYANLVPQVKPNFGADIAPKQLKATWLGHAAFLIEFPAVGDAKRGVRVLTDPVFSDRCSPLSFAGPKRYGRA